MTAPDIKVAEHPKERSGHWYTREGEQVGDIDGRKPTLRDARKHGWMPGVTTIIAMADRPQLNAWKEGQVLLSALTLPRDESEPEEYWVERVKEDAKQTAIKAAEDGTRIHAAIEAHFGGREYDGRYCEHVRGVVERLNSACGQLVWVPEKVCIHPLGYGTKSDLSSSDWWVLDFKGKEGDENVLRELKTYDEHAMQLAATRRALGQEAARCAIVYVSRTHPGVCWPAEVKEENLQRGVEMFDALLTYWKAKNKYDPSWGKEKSS